MKWAQCDKTQSRKSDALCYTVKYMLCHVLVYKILVYFSCYFCIYFGVIKPSLDCCVFEQNKLGDTPLHSAAWRGHAEIVKMLLERGIF